MAEPLTIEHLPPEILALVFHFLHQPAPSDKRLHDQPHVDMLRRRHYAYKGYGSYRDHDTLKAVALVSKRWHAVVLPVLFRNVVWYLDSGDLMKVREQVLTTTAATDVAIPVLDFLRAHGLTSYVKSFTLIFTSTYPWPDYALPTTGNSNNEVGPSRLAFHETTNWLWKLLFDVVDPLRFTIIASPAVLARLLARMIYIRDASSFDQEHHILSFSRREEDSPRRRRLQDTAATTTATASQQQSPLARRLGGLSPTINRLFPIERPDRRFPNDLFTKNTPPWTALLLNEGSSASVYETDEWLDKRPPSVLPALLGGGHYPNDVGLLTPQSGITDLSYVGIYPTASHLESLVHCLPPLRRLFVQLGPSSFDDVALLEERGWADPRTLWAERDKTYDDIMLKMLWDPDFEEYWEIVGAPLLADYELGNWARLEEFETGDAPDTCFWQLGLRRMAGEWWPTCAAKWKPGRYYGTFVQRKKDEALPIRDS